MHIEIRHHGGRDGVTGSCHELVIGDGQSLLVDCGLFQGTESSPDGGATARRLDIDFPVDAVRALVVTHVHVDHVGRIPWLLAAGFKGPILCSEPSARLLPIALADAFSLGVTRDAQLVERYLQLVESRLQPLAYAKWQQVVATPEVGCRIRLQRAGHILGSAYVECEILHRATGERTRVVFSGDLGAPHAPLLPAPRPPWSADVLVLESTYGDRVHESRRDRWKRLEQALERALTDGGTVIVPAFSIGRTQELLYELENIIHRRRRVDRAQGERWARLPIYLDSPLATRFTREYQALAPYWDAEAITRVRAGRSPLAFPQLVTIEEHTAHLANVHRLARTGDPAVVIAASGMCAGGRVVNYLKAMLGDARHNVLFVGYQAVGTPGRAIQEYGPRGGWVELDGERVTVRAGILTLPGYSAHADRDDLARFVTRMRHLPREIRLVHGDHGARQALAAHLLEKTGGRVVVLA